MPGWKPTWRERFSAWFEGYSMAFDPFPEPRSQLYEPDAATALRKGWEPNC
jgi:hypothetical protein